MIETLDDVGKTTESRLLEISRCSVPGDGVTRLPFTKEHSAANRIIAAWMEEAGLSVRLDSAGTHIGRIEGERSNRNRTFILGSHQDSVRNGGRYDGIMGIALACLFPTAQYENTGAIIHHWRSNLPRQKVRPAAISATVGAPKKFHN